MKISHKCLNITEISNQVINFVFLFLVLKFLAAALPSREDPNRDLHVIFIVRDSNLALVENSSFASLEQVCFYDALRYTWRFCLDSYVCGALLLKF